MLNYSSHYKHLANKTIDWLGSDKKEYYEYNLKHRFNQLQDNGWINTRFTYKFNSHGFRCSEFVVSNTIMFLGASITMGIGVPEHARWTNIVANNLNLFCANFGIDGSSCDTAFRFCHGYIDKIQPKIIVLLRPAGIRLEMVSNSEIHNIPHSTSRQYEDQDFYKEWIMDDNNNQFNFLKNIYAISHLCMLRKIKFLHVAELNVKLDLGRDLHHPGIKCHEILAKNILTQIDKLNHGPNYGN